MQYVSKSFNTVSNIAQSFNRTYIAQPQILCKNIDRLGAALAVGRVEKGANDLRCWRALNPEIYIHTSGDVSRTPARRQTVNEVKVDMKWKNEDMKVIKGGWKVHNVGDILEKRKNPLNILTWATTIVPRWLGDRNSAPLTANMPGWFVSCHVN